MYIQIHLDKLLNDRGITQKELATKTNIRAASIHKMYHNQTLRLPLDNLATICEVLECDIGDILTLEKGAVKNDHN